MYTSFSIENFRGFKKLELTDLARVNLIAGKNNTGKTSLLEAIHFHSGNGDRHTLFRGLGLPKDTSEQIYWDDDNEGWQWPFLFNHPEQDVVLSSTRTETTTQSSDDPLTIEKDLVVAKPSRGLKYNPRTEIRPKSTIGQAQEETSSVFLSAKLDTRQIPLIERYSQFYFNNKSDFKLVLDVLKVLDNRITDIRILHQNAVSGIYVELEGNRIIPLELMGEGTNRLLAILLSMYATRNGILLIDEIENGFHYSMLKQVWQAIYKAAQLFNVQVFATTHSYECINAAHEAFSELETDDLGLYRLDRHDDGEIKSVRYNQRTLSTAIEYNFEVR